MESIQELIITLTSFISNVIIPLLFGLALLFFLWNAVRFFIVGAGDKDAQDKAKSLAIYGIGAFVILVSIWGIVNLIVSGLGLRGDTSVTPDYFYNSESGDTESFRGPI